MEGKHGNVATFIVRVRQREHSTWQGNVIWADTKQESNFRSCLELIKLMEGAMADSGEEAQEEAPADEIERGSA
ncbi:MAG: hypothetical protein Q4F21_13930 [Lachnospiraceae bacterium]|nr:hypothetical protein [Lachnospiraceae bacterium]